MHSLIIRGGRPLNGTIRISGSKNAALPMLAATVLFRENCRISNCPALTDVDAALEILSCLGAKTERDGEDIYVNPKGIDRWIIPEPLIRKMRGSLFFAGPLMARFGRCALHTPGGCPLGNRPVNFHAMGLLTMGAKAEGDVFSGELTGGQVRLPYPSVGATENLIMAALGASGTTTIHNAAREPEIVCLCDFLRSGGADIRGDGTEIITIAGGLPDSGCLRVIPDRMEAATFACACASAGGTIRLEGAVHTHLTQVLDVLELAGCRIGRQTNDLTVESGPLVSPGTVTTGPYPAFPTDAQAPLTAALLRAEGETVIRETVFDRRLGHIPALRAMGANIETEGNTARILGVEALTGADVTAPDLRGGGALAVAALAARGESRIAGLHHILRGYGHFAGKLQALGADVRTV